MGTSRGFLDPAQLARKQLARDLREVAEPWLFRHKCDRMAASPFDFLRGSAPLFYAALRKAPELAIGPEGDGWLTGDLHLENFGVYRPQSLVDESKSDAVAFGVNDFDDAFVGPQRLDVLRLARPAPSWPPGAGACPCWPPAGRPRPSWTGCWRAAQRAGPGACPTWSGRCSQRAAARTRRQLLDARTEVTATGRRFIRGPRYRSLAGALRRKAVAAFGRYVRQLPAGRARRTTLAPGKCRTSPFAWRGREALACCALPSWWRARGAPTEAGFST